jgi:ribosomal protein S24E
MSTDECVEILKEFERILQVNESILKKIKKHTEKDIDLIKETIKFNNDNNSNETNILFIIVYYINAIKNYVLDNKSRLEIEFGKFKTPRFSSIYQSMDEYTKIEKKFLTLLEKENVSGKNLEKILNDIENMKLMKQLERNYKGDD